MNHAFALASLLFGTAAFASDPAPTDWVRREVSNVFSIEMPSSIQRTADTGADTLAGSFKGPDILISFDYGGWGPKHLEPESDSAEEFKHEDIVIDGLPAEIAWNHKEKGWGYPGLNYEVSVLIPNLAKGTSSLWIFAFMRSPEQFAETAKILKSTLLPKYSPARQQKRDPLRMDCVIEYSHLGKYHEKALTLTVVEDDKGQMFGQTKDEFFDFSVQGGLGQVVVSWTHLPSGRRGYAGHSLVANEATSGIVTLDRAPEPGQSQDTTSVNYNCEITYRDAPRSP